MGELWLWFGLSFAGGVVVGYCADTVRRRLRITDVRALWDEATWYEKVVLAFALAPIPGPFDEIAGILAVRRIARRVYLRDHRNQIESER